VDERYGDPKAKEEGDGYQEYKIENKESLRLLANCKKIKEAESLAEMEGQGGQK